MIGVGHVPETPYYTIGGPVIRPVETQQPPEEIEMTPL
jgi:hypothetical protein